MLPHPSNAVQQHIISSNMWITTWRQVGCSATVYMQLIMISCWCPNTTNKVNILTNSKQVKWRKLTELYNNQACNTVKAWRKHTRQRHHKTIHKASFETPQELLHFHIHNNNKGFEHGEKEICNMAKPFFLHTAPWCHTHKHLHIWTARSDAAKLRNC